MSEWKGLIVSNSPVWTGVVGYADERIAELTTVCANEESTDLEIRQAQKAIAELRRLKNMPDSLRASAEISSKASKRRGEY